MRRFRQMKTQCKKLSQSAVEHFDLGRTYLEAFAVDDGWSTLVVFLLRDPHLLEGGKRRQDGTTNPDGVFTLWWCDDLDLH